MSVYYFQTKQDYQAYIIIAESNNGGEMVELVIRQIDPNAPVAMVTESRDKHTRAEPIAALYEQWRHMVNVMSVSTRRHHKISHSEIINCESAYNNDPPTG